MTVLSDLSRFMSNSRTWLYLTDGLRQLPLCQQRPQNFFCAAAPGLERMTETVRLRMSEQPVCLISAMKMIGCTRRTSDL